MFISSSIYLEIYSRLIVNILEKRQVVILTLFITTAAAILIFPTIRHFVRYHFLPTIFLIFMLGRYFSIVVFNLKYNN